uniref:Uncharacterized protein n=1 Tax=Anguilla anguilla TaxID=7936 RepID=A0A0E9SN70_ANGAN
MVTNKFHNKSWRMCPSSTQHASETFMAFGIY